MSAFSSARGRANSVGGWHLSLEGVVEMKHDAVLEFTVYLVDGHTDSMAGTWPLMSALPEDEKF